MASQAMSLPTSLRADFPILSTEMNGKPLIYFDNGATTQKPKQVIDALVHYYEHDNANIHRGLYELSQRATDGYEAAREKVAKFINARVAKECIFVRGTTEAVNVIAKSWGGSNLQPGDEVIVTGMEHHSNIVPWQMVCEQTGAKLLVWYSNEDGELDIETLKPLLSEKTKVLATQHVSNALGNIHPVSEIVKTVKELTDAVVVVDGAQWVAHGPTDVQELGCDFYVFSGHKLFGPTGIGVLWGRQDLLESLPPYEGGGDMIETVSFDNTTYAGLPNRLEAGTPDIAGAIGLGAAVDYVRNIGFESIAAHESALLAAATDQLKQVPGLRILGDTTQKAAVISFVLEQPSIAPMDIASFLAQRGIAIRTGHHCCMPLMDQLQVGGTSRASFAMYNTLDEIKALADALHELVAQRTEAKAKAPSTVEDQPVTFATASADTVVSAAAELAEEFLEFDDRESKTELLMDLGQEVADDFEQLKRISTAVPGCMSEVYLVGRPCEANPNFFEFAADSNAQVVRGLIAILQKIYSGQEAQQIINFDIADFFRKIGLDEFVSTQRRSGLDGMIRRIHTLSQAILDRQ